VREGDRVRGGGGKVTCCFEMCNSGNLPVLVTTIYSQIITMNQPSVNDG